MQIQKFDLSHLKSAVQSMTSPMKVHEFMEANPEPKGDAFWWALPKLQAYAESLNFPVSFRDPDELDQLYQLEKLLGIRKDRFCHGMAASKDEDYTEGVIYLHPESTVDENTRVLCHEIAHVLVAHTDNVANDEITAESTAHVVCKELGLNTWNFSMPYVTPHYHMDDGKFFDDDINTAANAILDGAFR